MNKRVSGILLHISSLPSKYGIGDFGPQAYKFADFLKKSGQSVWQVLPLTYTYDHSGNSPYSSISAFAGNPLFISPELLIEEGLITKEDMQVFEYSPKKRVEYSKAKNIKNIILNKAYENFKENFPMSKFKTFCNENSYWLDSFASFMALRKINKNIKWNKWHEDLSKVSISSDIEKEKFIQYVFFKQWFKLKKYCNKKGIKIIGDIPYYVNFDSADVWARPNLFKLNADKEPVFVSGVPPDYFSKTGQLWGNPVYNWEENKNSGYHWWIKRLEQNFKFFDIVRIDHFRGFSACWEVSSKEKTAINGSWVKVPGEDFFRTMLQHFKTLPIIAEDLGIITKSVKDLMQKFNFPGMKIMLFAFGDDFPKSSYLPDNFINNCIAYTGTHDNNTVKGWFEKEATEKNKNRLFSYIKSNVSKDEISNLFIKLIMESRADTVIFPMQDILNLGVKARMNIPGKASGNWEWCLLEEDITTEIANNLFNLTKTCHRKS